MGNIKKLIKIILYLFALFAVLPTICWSQSNPYVPPPQPVQGNYLIGAYYMPKTTIPGYWWLMTEKYDPNKNIRWPALGLYKADNPEILDWQTKWALEHGISLWVFDWYWQGNQGPRTNKSIDAFLQSRFEDQIKFAIMPCALTENWGRTPAEVKTELLKMTDYWIANYFNQPNYLKIDGKPLIIFYHFYKLIEGLGGGGAGEPGWENLKDTLSEMRTKIIQAGFSQGPFLTVEWNVACASNQNRHQCFQNQFNKYKEAGFDALTDYGCAPSWKLSSGEQNNTIEYSRFVDNCLDNLRFYTSELSQSPTHLKLLLPFVSNYDDKPIGRDNPRITFNPNINDYQRLLNGVKAILDNPTNANVLTSWQGKKIAVIEAWNEWQEGSELEPGVTEGGTEGPFSFLNRLRSTFFPSAPHYPDILPSQIGLGPYDVPTRRPVSSWIFNNEDSLKDWYNTGGATDLKIVGENAESRISYWLYMFVGVKLNSADFKKAKIKARLTCQTQTCGGNLIFRWISSNFPYNEVGSRVLALNQDKQFHEYIFDPQQDPKWTGEIQQLEFVVRPNESSLPAQADISFIKIESGVVPTSTLTPTPTPTNAPGPTSTPTPGRIPGDVNGDGHVNLADYSIFVKKYGSNDQSCDFNKNGSVDMGDYSILVANYGR